MIVVLVSGYACAGKSTFANFLYAYLNGRNYEVYKGAFANEVKSIATQMGWDGEKDAKGRKLLQDIGRVGREYDINIWAKKLVDNYAPEYKSNAILIVDDWRYPNEFDYVCHDEGVHEIYAVRVINSKLDLTQPMYRDVSETSLDDDPIGYDLSIDNSYCLDDLKGTARELANYIIEEM